MSRETDTSSSGPNGRGGPAYPSGTPPYGIPAVSDDRADAGGSAAREERKTETTLTTRIRINIPGSRPIPPVVVRKPVSSADSEARTEDTAEAGTGDETQQTPAAPAAKPSAEPAAEPPAQPEEKTVSDWFAPRKFPVKKSGQSGSTANTTGPSAGSSTASRPGTGPSGTGPSGAGPSGTGTSGTGAPGAGPSGTGGGPLGAGPSGPRPGARPGTGSAKSTGLPSATGGPVAPGHGGGTDSLDVTEALPVLRPDFQDFEDEQTGQTGQAGQAGQGDQAGQAGQSGPGGFDGPGGPGGPQGPAGPTGGPVTGDGRLRPNTAGGPAGHPGGAPGAPGAPGPYGARPGGGLSDDTAVLTPQKPAPAPRAPGYGGAQADTTRDMPVITPGVGEPFDDGPGSFGPTPPEAPGEDQDHTAASSAAPKKGRGKLPLLVGGVVLVAGVAYGAGLLMNRSDVPKGTTVLGVDIGGSTRDEAVKKLDRAFGERMNQPLKLSVDGKTVTLKPEQAGLRFDTQATAGAAAKSDYNPVSVIGSLFGNQREIEPRMPVDEEKLQAALKNVSGSAGSVVEGGIKFESGRAVPVYGKPGKGIDVARSTEAIQEAYRTQVETGSAAPVRLPTTTQQPTVSDAEVDRMMKEFAEPAMSANVIARTDETHFIEFSPQRSLWKFLRVKAVNGKLVDSPDLKVLEELYGKAFEGVLITRGTGEKTPVTPQDVYGALRKALVSKTDRDVVIETNPS
ncbi:hypothetical protein [Streptomyces sp. F-3]|uniref:hypothetical protein n=1 Tax=Streptomyces sp. F-3 TaxID=1840095 RepID=UPI0008379513|nr:hypothetical protein [Streptomyces sp. F-3]